MKRKIVSLLGVLSLAATLASAKDEATSKKTVLTIDGMTCGGCVAAVKVKLKKTEGVLSYEVSLENGEAEVQFDPDKTDPEKIAAAVTKTGFKARVKKEKTPEGSDRS